MRKIRALVYNDNNGKIYEITINAYSDNDVEIWLKHNEVIEMQYFLHKNEDWIFIDVKIYRYLGITLNTEMRIDDVIEAFLNQIELLLTSGIVLFYDEIEK